MLGKPQNLLDARTRAADRWTRPRPAATLALLVLFLGVATSVLSARVALLAAEEQRVARIEQQARLEADSLAHRLRLIIRSIERMGLRWSNSQPPEELDWLIESSAMIGDMPEISYLGWIDTAFAIRRLVPDSSDTRAQAARAVETNIDEIVASVITGNLRAVGLTRTGGGRVRWIDIAVRGADRSGQATGFVLASLDIDRLLDTSISNGRSPDFDARVVSTVARVAAADPMLDGVHERIPLPGGETLLVVRPTDAYLARTEPTAWRVLGTLGAGLSILLSVTLWNWLRSGYYVRRLRRVTQLVGRSRNRSLQRTAELAELRQRFETALQVGGVGTWEYDVRRARIRGDRNTLEMLGLPVDAGEDIDADELAARIPEHELAEIRDALRDALATGHLGQLTISVSGGRDGIRYLEAAGDILAEGAHGDSPVLTGVIKDVTRQKNLEIELRELADRDSLTRLLNRRRFDQLFRLALAQSHRRATPLSLLLVDIDHFKLFNDTAGHSAGDRCLQRVAELMHHTCTRETDIVARYGGEEFAILLGDTDADGAACVAERLLESVRACGIPHPAPAAADTVGISIGGVSQPVGQRMETGTLFEAADAALYEAKKRGRNRYVAWSPEAGSGDVQAGQKHA